MLRKYRCHKVVEAGEITDVAAGTVKAAGQEFFLTDLGNKGEPAAGDFIVRYEDGHCSWSPRKAFLDGYSPIDESGADYQPETKHPE